METEATDPYNNGIREIVDILYSLRRIEFSSQSMNSKHREAGRLIEDVMELLAVKKDFITFRPMWEELHDRMVYYYDFLNKENMKEHIPLFRMTLHNEAAKWWLSCKKKGILKGPLVHFDTHDDIGLPESSKYLLKKNGTLDEEGIRQGSCGKIFWPITCILLSKGVDHVIWGMPQWVYDDNAGFDQVLTCTKQSDEFLYLRPPGQKFDNFRITGDVEEAEDGELEDIGRYKFYHPFHIERLRCFTASAWNKMGRLIDNKKFILDIDLDFFACNGDKHSLASYKIDFDDLESTGRAHGLPGMVTPRAAYSDDVSVQKIKDLNKEMNMIRKRIDTFLSGLRTLKGMGIKPCCIDISDSAPTYFSGSTERAVFTNQYTPKYFVPIIHALLISGLRKLYGANAFY
jgi:hypothetical protein